ncbi:hypothetical protein OXT66_05565 [Lentilactobacillus senioris]|uniref:hypothetical protein n=1 Tax=Lentilactobacillus senioris TaxID=931534 RepID=UPI0022808FDE|nr:hypothetical protein [Lentilactobacillus senioris]MCY9807018.1 hypothetical protein [Lentilactobacillus senioris]
MAKWNKIVITNAGYQLSAATLAGNTISYTRAQTTDKDMSGLTSEQLKEITKLESVAQDLPLGTVSVQDDHTVNVPIKVMNSDLQEDYLLYGIAIFAKIEGGEEILYGIATSVNPDLIPAQNGSTVVGTTFKVKLHVGDAANVTIVVSPDGSVSNEELESILNNYVLTSDLDKLKISGRNYMKDSATPVKVGINWGTERYAVLPTYLDDATGKITFSAKISELADNNDGKISIGLCMPGDANNGYGVTDVPIVDSTLTVTFDVPEEMSDRTAVLIYGNSGIWDGSETGHFTLINSKLEKGTQKTDWTPAPEDMMSKADMADIQKGLATLEDIQKLIDQNADLQKQIDEKATWTLISQTDYDALPDKAGSTITYFIY